MENIKGKADEKKKMLEIAKEIEADGKYTTKTGRKYIYVCQNNGAIHTGNMEGVGGYAKFIGKFSYDVAVEWLKFIK